MKKSTVVSIIGFILVVAFLSATLGQAIFYGKQPDIASFITIHFAGYLFFLVMPVELLLPYYMAQGHAILTLWILAVITAMVAQIIDFGIGYAAPHDFVKEFIGKQRYKKYKKVIDRWGNITILFFNLFPISSPLIVLIAGMLRFRLRGVLFFSFIGLMIKYWFITTVFMLNG